MEAQKCDCYGCHNELIYDEDIILGICQAHRQLMDDDENYIGVCWNCCRVTIIGPRRSSKGRLHIKDKYIFSKGCRHCTGKEESGIDWMTINIDSFPTSYVKVVMTEKGPRGKILPITNNINNDHVVISGRQ